MLLLVYLFISLSFTSCATVINGKSQEVVIESVPAGAKVIQDGQEIGTTPCTVEVIRKQDHTISLLKDGHYQHDVELTRSLSPVCLLYALPGGSICLGLDSIHGSQYRFEKKYRVQLDTLFHARRTVERQFLLMRKITQSIEARSEARSIEEAV